MIIVHVPAINTDPELWGPNSYEWKPERWLKPLPEELLNARIPGVYSHLYVPPMIAHLGSACQPYS